MGRSAMAWPPGDGAMAERVRTHDWAATPLGAAATWPDRIRAVVELVLASPLVSAVALGDARLLIYNDAAARLYGARHPGALGRPLAAVFPDSYPAVAPLYDRVFAGESVPVAAQPLALDTGDEIFDAYLSPVRDAAGAVIAAHMVGLEIGAQQRDAAALRDSEARYRTLFEAIGSGFCIIELIFEDGRATDYRFVEANPAFERQSGLIDAVERRIREFAPDLEEHWFERYGQVALTGEPLRIEGEVAPLGRWFDINAFRVGDPGQHRVAVLFTDITARRNADAVLLENEERQRFLLKLSDALRPLAEPFAIQVEAMRVLGQHLAVNRAQYHEIEPNNVWIKPGGGYANGVSLHPGSSRMDDFGAFVRDAYEGGRTLVVCDTESDARLDPAARAAFAGIGVRAFIAVPLVKNGSFVGVLGLDHVTARSWSQAEIALAEEVAERTWAAVERAQAERALRDREADLARVQRIGAVGGVHVDVAHGLRSWRSPEYLRLHGLPPGTPQSTHDDWRARVVPEDREMAERALFAALEGDATTYDNEYRIARPSDGAIRWIHARGDIERAPDGTALRLVGAHIDVTNQKHAQDLLRQSEERQAFLLGLSDVLRPLTDPVQIMVAASAKLGHYLDVGRCGYGEVDATGEFFTVVRDWTDGRMASFADQHRLLDFGPEFTAAYRAGRSVLIHDALADARAAGSEAAFAAAGGVRASLGVPLIKDGRFVAGLFAQQTTPRRWTPDEAALVREVAERTWEAVGRARAETVLREREAELARAQRIGQVASVEVILTDPPTGLRSPEYRRLHGLAPDDAVETHREWLARVHPDDRARADREFFAAIDGDDVLESEYRIVRPSDGELRWISARGMIERDAHGAATRLLGAHIDITERKRADLAVRESEERQAFLLEISDALRPLEDAAAIERTAVDLLGAKLGVNRAFYATVQDDGDTVIVRHAYVDGVDAGTGRHSIASFRPDRMPEWQAGQMTMTADSETDPKFGDFERAAYASVSSRAAVGVPLVKRGRLVALLAVNQATPRAWTDQETSLIADVAERTWLAVDRARVETALHETEERLQQFGEASQDVLWIRDAETFQWEYLTPAFETIYGLARAAALRGDNMTGWLELIVPEDRDYAAKSLARVRAGEWVTFQFRFRRPSDGGIRWMRNTDFPIKDAAGNVVRIGGIGHDITALKETERALAEAEQRQRALLEGIPQLVWRAVEGGRWTWASPQWTAVTGQADPDSHEYGWLDPVHPDDRAGVLDVWKGAIARGEFHADYRICHQPTGRYRWFQTRATPVRDDDGAIVEWLGTSTDVDDQRRLQEHQGVLLAELQHRVRNILAIIRSIMRRSLDGEESLQDYAQHLEGRITALARTQVLLTRQVNANVDLEELIRDELTAQAADDARIVITGPDVDLSPRAAEVLALAMHELATNSVKYGAIAHPDAALRVEWRLEQRDDARWLYLIWSELGVPVAAGASARAGFGTELITRRVPYELKGAGELAIKSGGIVCTISFPLIDRPSILETGPTEATRGMRP